MPAPSRCLVHRRHALPQLINWQKRRSTPPAPCRLFRLAAHSAGTPQYLVPKAVAETRGASLDPRGAFVVQLPGKTLVWRVRSGKDHERGSGLDRGLSVWCTFQSFRRVQRCCPHLQKWRTAERLQLRSAECLQGGSPALDVISAPLMGTYMKGDGFL